MPKINFDAVPDNNNNFLIPPGEYLCQVTDVRPKTTSKGSEMWSLQLQVQEGTCGGRWVWDNLVFTQNALPRVKLVCGKLGLDVRGEIDLQPGMLIGRKAMITIETEDYEANDGSMKKRNVVPFDGYETVENARAKENVDFGADEEDVPLGQLPF